MKNGFPLFLILGAALAQAAEPVGQPISLEGAVSAQAPSAAARALALKGAVFMQDTIRTAADAKTQILFADDTVFSQGPNTDVVIDEFVYDPSAAKNNAFKARVERGVFRTVTGKITDLNPDKFEIKTGRATIAIRGCGVSGQLSDRRDEISIDFVRTGRVVVVTPFGGKPVEFREPGLLVIEDGGRVHKERFDHVRFLLTRGATTPNGESRNRGMEAPGGKPFRRSAGLIQAETVAVAPPSPKPKPLPPKPVDPAPPAPDPWPVFGGGYSGFAMNQLALELDVNPLDTSALDSRHATENMVLALYSEQANPATPGAKLYEWPYSVSVPPAYKMPVFGSEDAACSVTSERIDAETFQAHLVGADYDVTMSIRRGGPDSDWFKAWWGMDDTTPAQVADLDFNWSPCQGYGILGNTYSSVETAALKGGDTVYELQQAGAGWAAGMGNFSLYVAGMPTAGNFVMEGAPVSTLVRIGGGQDTWSTRLQLQDTSASAVPASCDVVLTGSLLDASQRFNASVTPAVNGLTIAGHDFQGSTVQAFGTGRLVGRKQPGDAPSGMIGSVTMSGFQYGPAGSGNYKMNLHFGTDLKKGAGGIGP